MPRFTRTSLLVLLALTLLPMLAQAQHTIFAVDNASVLLRFSSATPGTIDASVGISGLQGGETIVGMDFRPANGQLYAVTNQSRLYLLDPVTGAATQVGADGAFALSGGLHGMDFNPVPDRIRLVSSTNENQRVNPNDGTLTALDTPLAYDAADVNTGVDPAVLAAAYNNNFAGTASTTLFGLDIVTGSLVRQGSVGGAPTSPNSGTLFTIGALGTAIGGGAGFDITPDGTAYLADGQGTSSFFTVNLATGAASLVGQIGGGLQTVALAAAAPPPACPPLQTLYGAAFTGPNAGNNLQSLFYSINPATGAASLIGDTGFEQVSGMAFRRSDSTLFAIGERADGTNTRVLITIDPCTGIGSEVGPTGTFRAQDISFSTVDGTTLFGNVANEIYTFNTGSGAGTLVGDSTTGFGAGLGLAFDFTGTLFRANSASLETVDTATGMATFLVGLDFSASSIGRVNAMDINPLSATVFGTGPFSTLVTVNTISGVVADVGPTQAGMDAIAFAPMDTDLAVTKVDDVVTVAAVNDVITYTITVTNNGPGVAGAVQLTDTFTTATASYVAASVNPSQGTCDDSNAGAGMITCALGRIDPAEFATVTFQVMATATGSITDDVSVTTGTNDPNTANNAAQVVTGVGSADVSVTKAEVMDPVNHAGFVSYIITVTNTDAVATAGGVVVTDTPSGAAVTFFAANPAQGTCNAALPVVCNLGDIPANTSVLVTVDFATTAAGTVTNTVTVTSATSDTNAANDMDVETTTVNAINLVVTKTDAPDPTAVGGGNVTYTVTVTNSGTLAATAVMLADNFTGAAATFVSATPSAGTCTPAFPAVPCALGNIAIGANVTVSIVVTPTAGGTITNTATATATEAEPVSTNANNTAVATTTVAAMQDFAVSGSPNSRTILPGNTTTFTVTVTPLPFVASVALSCSHDIPLGSCSISPSTVNPGNLVATATLTVSTTGFFTAQHRAPNQQAPVYAYWLPATAGFGALGVVLLGANRKRLSRNRRAQFLAILSLLLAITLLAGCPLGRDRQDEGTPGGTFTVTITGVGGSPSVTRTDTVDVVVQGSN